MEAGLKVQFVVGLLFLSAVRNALGTAETHPDSRSDRAIFTIRVDQKGSSYIIHPDLSRLEAEALLLATRPNASSFFYNVTGLTADEAVEVARSTPYSTTASAHPASKLLLEALLHNFNSDPSSATADPLRRLALPNQASGLGAGKTEWDVVHNGDPISVEDVTHKVFHAATNRVSAQHHHPLMANKPEQLIPSSLVKVASPTQSRVPMTTAATTTITTKNRLTTGTAQPAPVKIQSSTAVKHTRPVTTPTTTKRTTPSTTEKPTTTTTVKTSLPNNRTENPFLRLIETTPEEEQDFYDEEEYEDYEETEIEPPAAESTTTTTTTRSSVTKGSSQVASGGRPSPTSISYIPLDTLVTKKNGILTLAMMNATVPPVRLPEYTVKTGPSGVPIAPLQNVNSSSLITKTDSSTYSSSPTTKTTTQPSTTTTSESFDLTDFLVRVAGEASDLLLKQSIAKSSSSGSKISPPLPELDTSIFGTLFSSDQVKKRVDTNRVGQSSRRPQQRPLNRPSRPDAPLLPGQFQTPPPPPARGSVHNLNRPALFSAFNPSMGGPAASVVQPQPAVSTVLHPKLTPPVELKPPQQQQKQLHARPDEMAHHNRPNTDALIPLYSSPGRPASTVVTSSVTEQPSGEVDVITAPSQWNLIVSSSLTSSGQSKVSSNRNPVPSVPSTSLSHRHGYIVDDAEAVVDGRPTDDGPPFAGDGLLQHQDSPSRLGVAIDYDTPLSPTSAGSPPIDPEGVMIPEDYLGVYQDYEDDLYDGEEPILNRTSTSTTTLFPNRQKATTARPPLDLPPFPYGVNLGDLNDSKEQTPVVSLNSSEELEGFGAAFPEVINNSVRRVGDQSTVAGSSVVQPTKKRPDSGDNGQDLDDEKRRPEVFHTEQAIDVYDKKFEAVEVDAADLPHNTTDLPSNGQASQPGSGHGQLTGAALTYILIGTFGGLSLLFLCAVGVTIRCRKRRFMFSTFTSTMMRRSDQHPSTDEESQSGSPNVLSGRRIANQQLAAGRNSTKGQSSQPDTHKLGPWFTGRNSLSSLPGGGSQIIHSTRKLRPEVALPRTTPNTPGQSSSGRNKVSVTRAYFTDGRTGSTRDLITSTTSSSSGTTDSSESNTPVHSPRTPHLPERDSWLHKSYKDRGNSLSELRDSSFYCLGQPDEASSDGERPRSTSATVRSPLHHFHSSEDLDSIEALNTPPDLPPKRQQQHNRFSMGDSMSAVVPMGSHVTIQTEASVTNQWGSSIDDRLI